MQLYHSSNGTAKAESPIADSDATEKVAYTDGCKERLIRLILFIVCCKLVLLKRKCTALQSLNAKYQLLLERAQEQCVELRQAVHELSVQTAKMEAEIRCEPSFPTPHDGSKTLQ